MRIAIVGPGRLGRTLYRLLADAGATVTLTGRGQPVGLAEVVVLAVPDAAVAEAARAVPMGRIVLHCAGSLDVDVLRPHRPAGSFHPLMTFPGPEIGIPDAAEVAVALAGDAEAVDAGQAIARRLGFASFTVPGDRRLYHCAAVIAGNFATVLLAEAADVLTKAGVPPDRSAALLLPLALRSLRNAVPNPRQALTGPAARGDDTTIEAHRTALRESGLADLLPLYDQLTDRARRVVQVAPRTSDEEDDP